MGDDDDSTWEPSAFPIPIQPSTAAIGGYAFGFFALVGAFLDYLSFAAGMLAVAFLCFAIALVLKRQQKTHCIECGAYLRPGADGELRCPEPEYH